MARMDHLYRFIRHFYDVTRKFFLFGRDEALTLIPPDARSVVEIGCGTARNLIKLSRLRPSAALFGVDASREMLETAAASLARDRLAGKVVLRAGLAEDLDPSTMFERAEPFDAAIFSYSLSMMPTWREAIDAALRSVKPGGTIVVVDFWDQAAWPRPCRAVLTWWLSLFGVKHQPALLSRLHELQQEGRVHVDVRGIMGRYAWLGVVIVCPHK
jgi:S-adenosylmethionine-diacylgycerolhomoserine-N-methlytransferase